MNIHNSAEENLRAIRSLMEKATIYRAISAPSALVGGMVSLVASCSLALFWSEEQILKNGTVFWQTFLGAWLLTLSITAGANIWFLRHESKRRNEPFVSAGMKLALQALLPPLLTGAVFSATFYNTPLVLCLVWMLFYGLGLLATRSFAPRSIPLLGWAFLLSGLGCTEVILNHKVFSSVQEPQLTSILMASTFGFFHLVYAVATWPRTKTEQPAPASTTVS